MYHTSSNKKYYKIYIVKIILCKTEEFKFYLYTLKLFTDLFCFISYTSNNQQLSICI